jgi:hypothetical protein
MENTTSFGLRCGIASAKGKAPTDAYKYGGASYTTPGVGDQILVSEPSIQTAPTMLDDESVNGSQFASGQDVAFLPVAVSATHDMRVIGSGKMLYHALGYESLQGPVASGTKHAHLFLIDPKGKDQREYTSAEKQQDPTIQATDIRNAYFNFVCEEGPGDHIAQNTTIKEFTISCEAKNALKLQFSGSAQSSILDSNKTASSAMTLNHGINEMKRFKFSDAYLLNAYVGKWNEAGTEIVEERECMTAFSITNSFGQAEGVGTTCSGLAQAEPVADGLNELTVELTRFKYDTHEWLESMKIGQEISFRIGFKIGDYVFKLFIPRMKINDATGEVGDGGKIKIVGRALISNSTVDPFKTERTIGTTEMTLPFDTGMYCILVDDVATNYMRAV